MVKKLTRDNGRVDGRGCRPGEKRGGRTPGARDSATLKREKAITEAMAAATAAIGNDKIQLMSPMDVMLYVMRLAAAQGWWFKSAEIAKEVAPYLHAKLASTVIDDRRRRTPEQFGDDELLALYSAEEEVGVVEQRPN